MQNRGVAGRSLVAAGGFALVFFGMAVAPMIVSGRTPVEEPLVAATSPEPVAPSAVDRALKRAFDLRLAATETGNLDQLTDAVTALEAALPGQQGSSLAAVENELGLAKRSLAQEQKDEALLAEAVAHYRRALSGFEAAAGKGTATVLWNLAIALRLQAGMSGDNAPLREAADLLRDLVASGDAALDRKAANRHLGEILLILGEADNSTRALAESVTALEAALADADKDNRDRVDWADTQNALATALQVLGEREWSLERLEAALNARRNAWVLYQSAGLDSYRFYFDTRIAALEVLIASRRATPIQAAAAAAP